MRNRKHDIERYLRGELSPAEMHALEKEALNDPFLAEALEGVEQAGADNFLFDLHKLNQSVHHRTRHRKDKTLKMWGWTAGLAAAILLVAVSGFVMVSLLEKQRAARQQAMREQDAPAKELQRTEDSLAAKPSVEMESDETRAESPAETPSQEFKQAPAEETKRPGPAQVDTSGQERTPDPEALLADLVPEKETNDPEADEPETVVEQEPITLAEITEERPVSRKKEAPDDEAIPRALQGRAAGSEVKTGAVTRSRDAMALRGKVTSATDGEAIPGANINLKGTNIGTVADAEGNYQLSVPDDNRTLVFSFIGFESHEVQITDHPELNVALQEDVTSLSEVVVVSGYGAQDDSDKSTTFRMAEPHGGKSDFKNYLNRTIKYPEEALRNKTEGRVTVRFAVETDGRLTDFEVVKGIGFGCDEALIRAIREGPTWQPGSRGDVPLRDKVKVRFKFELP